jgi:TorA maturation chaperone TorD
MAQNNENQVVETTETAIADAAVAVAEPDNTTDTAVAVAEPDGIAPGVPDTVTYLGEDRASFISWNEQRVMTYGFLSRLYGYEVDQPMLDQIHDTLYPAATGDDDMDQGYLLIATYLSNLDDSSLTDLAIDYSRSFCGNGTDTHAAAYPHESVYTSEKRLTMQEARDEVLALYRSEGLEISKTWTEREDHIALELEFVQELANRAIARLKTGDDDIARRYLVKQRNFIEDHLYSWTPMMTADLRKFAKTELYQGLAFLTDGFLANDLQAIDDILAAWRVSKGKDATASAALDEEVSAGSAAAPVASPASATAPDTSAAEEPSSHASAEAMPVASMEPATAPVASMTQDPSDQTSAQDSSDRASAQEAAQKSPGQTSTQE